jgi:small subunit ribosomal protein S27e
MVRELVPLPKSKFIDVKCPDCGNTQTVFSHSAMKIRCKVCGSMLVQPTGGQAIILGTVVAQY